MCAVGQHLSYILEGGYGGGGLLEPANPKKSKNYKHVRDVCVLRFPLCENLKRGHWFRGPEENCTQLIFRDVL